ncbi:alpha/beta-hydrolase [Obba rivulosa]|uniref:Alpha/beta-hydrolase n=1 Tax=Obba rivulosa TaxID=1052685 RepID=A0A8E2AK27_9APHY|nr:alpha/beta-hydrolase [Obba rivulosa]
MACADCVSGSIHPGTPAGTEITLAGLPTYAVGDAASTRIVIFGTDIFGWKLVNTRLLVDEYAARGFRVLVPDLFDGYELPQWTLGARDPVNEAPSLFQRVVARPLSLFVLAPFVLRNSQGAQNAKITALVSHLRAAHPGAKIGFVGFCWGGRYAITLNGLFEATVAAHPSLVKYPAELDCVSKPISFELAATDHDFNAARGMDAEKRLKEKGLEYVEMVIYEGVQHGWTIRCDLKDEQKKEARDRARDQAIRWFERFLSTDDTAGAPTTPA